MSDPNHKSFGEKTGLNSVLGVSPSTRDFVTEAAIGDMFEIQSSQLALRQATPDLRGFAQQMIDDHTRTSGELKAMLRGPDETSSPPATLDDKHQKLLDELRDKSAAQFDERYIKDQVSAHKEAVSLFERYADSGDNMQLKDWAARTVPTLRSHLKMAEDLKDRRS